MLLIVDSYIVITYEHVTMADESKKRKKLRLFYEIV